MLNRCAEKKYTAITSELYAVSLTPETKRKLMERIRQKVLDQQDQSPITESVTIVCKYLNQCFESKLDSIRRAVPIILRLLSHRGNEQPVMESYRKLVSYVPGVIDCSNASELASYMQRVSCLALENGQIAFQTFPLTATKCILMMVHHMPIKNWPERKIIHHALRSTLSWYKVASAVYRQCGFGMLIRSAIASADSLQDDAHAMIKELIVLVHHLFDVFYTSHHRVEVHPVDVLLRSAYDRIFARLITEWTDRHCYGMLLSVLYDLLKRPISGSLKLEIVRSLSDAVGGGGIRRLLRFLYIRKHLHEDDTVPTRTMLQRMKTIVTIILAHALYRYESEQEGQRLRELLANIEQMINTVDLGELIDARFICLRFPREKLKLEALCLMFIVRHLGLLEGAVVAGTRFELDYVYNLVASVNVIHHKRWIVPRFLVKHFIEGLSRFSHHEALRENIPNLEPLLEAILPSMPDHVPGQPLTANIFGRLPVTIERIQWIKLQPRGMRQQLIVQQQFEFLQEGYVALFDERILTTLQSTISTDTLFLGIFGSRITSRGRFCASLLLSKRTLSGTRLARMHNNIKRNVNHRSIDQWLDWTRAIYGSVDGLDRASRRSLLAHLDGVPLSGDFDQLFSIVFELRARLLASLLLGNAGNDRQVSKQTATFGCPSNAITNGGEIEPATKKRKI
ncbi:uncharacterized protein LOC118464965 [Anopheles albimanus]|uniref:Uncharacterized protein n=1 Tax=Anopheles albimanus TaxID=7167 RepID=A0A182FGY3_ANOAL|nr:uncharacterized protein LOC118464965 [Anopheles albimanus]